MGGVSLLFALKKRPPTKLAAFPTKLNFNKNEVKKFQFLVYFSNLLAFNT